MNLDENSDGLLSLQELSVLYPDLSQDRFDLLDANRDGFVSVAELEAVSAPGGCNGPGGMADFFLFGIAVFFLDMWERITRFPHQVAVWISSLGEDD